jgi:catechol-2,3-dioxygenase
MNFSEVRLPAKDVDAQAVFYGNLLGLPTLHRSAGEVHFQVGRSRLVFVQTPAHGFAPQHFAFNIPEHRFEDAKAWLQARCELIPDEAGNEVFFLRIGTRMRCISTTLTATSVS